MTTDDEARQDANRAFLARKKNTSKRTYTFLLQSSVSALTGFSLKEKRRARSAGILRCRAVRSFSKSSYIGIPIFIPERSLD